MNRKTSKWQMIFFVCLINVAFFGSLEIVTRFILWGVSSDHYALLYWFDSDIRILVSDLSTMEITFHKEGEIDSKLSPNNDVLLNPFINAGIQGKKLVVWAFGGSTTAGYNCSTKASSWPEELQKIRRDFTVINHGRNGADSDFSILRLKGLLRQEKPNIAFWANQVNEADVLTYGLARNEELYEKYPTISKPKVSLIVSFVHSLNLTFYRTFLSYVMAKEFISRLLWKLGVRKENTKITITDSHIKMGLENYSINTIEAIRLAEIFDFKLIITIMPVRTDIDGKDLVSLETKVSEFYAKFYDRLRGLAAELAETSSHAYFISVSKEYFGLRLAEKFFCDGAHQHLEGNILTSKIIEKKLTLFSELD